MRHLKENLLVQFSVVSLVIILALAAGIETLLSTQLGHQIEDMETHNALMMAGMFDNTDGHSMMMEGTEGQALDDSTMAGMFNITQSNTVMASTGAQARNDSMTAVTTEHGHEASMPHIIQNVRNVRLMAIGAISGGFVLLYAGLVFIVWGGWRTISRQQASLVKVNTEVREANDELTTFADRLERSNQELQDFASVAAHDLQEPLRKVQAFGDRLKSKYSDAVGDQGIEYLNRMQDASGRMAILINDLLTFSRVTTKAEPFVPTDLAQIAQEVISDLEVRIEELGGRVELGNLPAIEADPLQMRQLLQNLVGNGLKFHREEEAPVVKVHGQLLNGREPHAAGNSLGGELCQITVEDNGIGFDEKYLDRIFTIFQRLHSRSEYQGTGVGLAVCRKIVERHSGTITATSTPGQGAKFLVTLPANQPKEGVSE